MAINNNIQEHICSKEVYTLLKLKGFGVTASNVYPTHTLAIEWIRVNFDIFIYIQPRQASWIFGAKEISNWNDHDLVDIDWYGTKEYLISKGVPTILLSPQEATDAALLYALKHLII